MIHILSFSLQNMFKNRNFHIKRTKIFKIYQNVSKIEGEIPKLKKNTKLKEKTQASGGFHPA